MLGKLIAPITFLILLVLISIVGQLSVFETTILGALIVAECCFIAWLGMRSADWGSSHAPMDWDELNRLTDKLVRSHREDKEKR
jgi:hypothetical protein